MLGGASEGAMQLPGRTSVVPCGQSCPGVTRVPPPRCAASAALIAPQIRMTRTVRKGRMEYPFSHEPNHLPNGAGRSELFDLVLTVPGAKQHFVRMLAEQGRAPFGI